MFAFPELISLTPRCGTFSFLCPSLLLFVIQAMISNVYHLVPLVQEMARRKAFGYRHMLRFFRMSQRRLQKKKKNRRMSQRRLQKKKKNRNNKKLIIHKKSYVYILNSDTLALIFFFYNSRSVKLLSHMRSKIDLTKLSSHNIEYLFSSFRFSLARTWSFIQGQLNHTRSDWSDVFN